MRISIIIPAYNEEENIEECIKSLSEQTNRDFEIILIDDGCTDNTIEKAKNSSKKFKINIKVLKQDHQGPGKARNLGAENSQGSILIFIDADMTFDKNYIKNLIKLLIQDKNKKIMGTTHDYEEATNTNNIWSNLWGKIRITRKDKNPRVYSGDVKIFRAIRKQKFLELGGFDPKYGYADDQTFWFKYKIKPVLAENTICYHKNPETLEGTFKQARWIGSSWKEKYKIFRVPIINYLAVIFIFILFPFAVFYKSFNSNKKFSFRNRILFYFFKFKGYLFGASRAVFQNKLSK